MRPSFLPYGVDRCGEAGVFTRGRAESFPASVEGVVCSEVSLKCSFGNAILAELDERKSI